MTEEQSDTTVLLDYTQAGGWNVLPDFAPPIITEAVGDKAIRYWQDLACANRKVAEDAQAQRDKAVAMLITHADHAYNCAVTDDKDCDCGLDALLKECGK